MRKKIKGFCLVATLALTFALSSKSVSAAEINNLNSTSIQSNLVNVQDDALLTPKESVTKYMKEHPENKDEVMLILRDYGALNPDGSIKDNLGVSKEYNTYATARKGTGYYYDLVGSGPSNVTYPKLQVVSWTNSSTNNGIKLELKESYTATTTVSSTSSIGSEANLNAQLKINASWTLTSTLTEAASTEFGASIPVPAKTRIVISASPNKYCYSYHEQYYVLGIAIGSTETVGVFVPYSINWFYNEYGA